MNTAEIIKHIRSKRGISRADLAKRLGVSIQSIHNWENGNNCPSSDMLIQIGRATGFGFCYTDLSTGGHYMDEPDEGRRVIR